MSDATATATATASTSTTSSISPTGTVSSGKDGMSGMTMDGCQISMLWNWYTVDTCFLSPSWKIRSQGGFAGLCIAIILMAILAQSLGWFAKYYDQRLVRQHQHKTVALATQATQNASTNGSLIAKHAHDLSPVAAFRPNLMQQAIRTLIRTVHFALAYWIMLLAMYYNGYIIICIIIVCSMCNGLEIECHYSDKRPDWMDGGEREKQMADHLKAMVKTRASERRERKWASDAHNNESQNAHIITSDNDKILSQGMASHRLDSNAEHENNESSSSSYTPATSTTEDSSGPDNMSLGEHGLAANIQPFKPVSEEVPNSNQMGMELSPYHTLNFPDIASERELEFSMLYLDYVFPYMSPFYRPPLIQGGRGWLLVLLMRNRPLYHTALSLASYFFSVMVGDSVRGHEACQRSNWMELQKQQELSIKALQNSMQHLTTRGVSESLADGIHCLEGIIQLLQFDATIGNASNWQMHLEAACSLFEQIMEHHATDNERPWLSILASLDERYFAITLPQDQRPWSSDQASFRFLTINLLWIDILASTALERAPRLERFHQQLLVGDNPSLRATDFLGCHNWVMLIIGQISALHAWKKEMKKSGALSIVELVKKASCIEKRLQEYIEQLSSVRMDVFYDPSARAPDHPLTESAFQTTPITGCTRTTAAQTFHTIIWARAALTYLTVVVSGFQPALPEVQTNIAETMDLFRQLSSPLCIRTLVWPFAVTGCLSLPGQEGFFRDLASNVGSLQVFGTIKEALQVMGTVWDHRSCIDADLWDISTCLNVLGYQSLLM
ncbi:C6 transcription factor [Seiridium cupressi]